LALNPHYAEAWNNLGAAYYGKHDFAAAEKAYKRALKYQARAAGTYSNLATLYFAEAKYKKGVKAYQRAFEIDPEAFTREKRQPIEEPATREQRMATAFYLAEVYASAGHNEAALASLRKAFSEGFSDRKRLMGDRQLASLRDTPEFHQLMAEQHFDELH
jgi:tetratricopeptide (TPR) repeat protein